MKILRMYPYDDGVVAPAKWAVDVARQAIADGVDFIHIMCQGREFTRACFDVAQSVSLLMADSSVTLHVGDKLDNSGWERDVYEVRYRVVIHVEVGKRTESAEIAKALAEFTNRFVMDDVRVHLESMAHWVDVVDLLRDIYTAYTVGLSVGGGVSDETVGRIATIFDGAVGVRGDDAPGLIEEKYYTKPRLGAGELVASYADYLAPVLGRIMSVSGEHALVEVKEGSCVRVTNRTDTLEGTSVMPSQVPAGAAHNCAYDAARSESKDAAREKARGNVTKDKRRFTGNGLKI